MYIYRLSRAGDTLYIGVTRRDMSLMVICCIVSLNVLWLDNQSIDIVKLFFAELSIFYKSQTDTKIYKMSDTNGHSILNIVTLPFFLTEAILLHVADCPTDFEN